MRRFRVRHCLRSNIKLSDFAYSQVTRSLKNLVNLKAKIRIKQSKISPNCQINRLKKKSQNVVQRWNPQAWTGRHGGHQRLAGQQELPDGILPLCPGLLGLRVPGRGLLQPSGDSLLQDWSVEEVPQPEVLCWQNQGHLLGRLGRDSQQRLNFDEKEKILFLK